MKPALPLVKQQLRIMGEEKEKRRQEKVNERKDGKLINASARENEQLKRRDEEEVENQGNDK